MKRLMVGIVVSVWVITASAFHSYAAPVKYDEFKKAMDECIATIDHIIDLDGPFLLKYVKDARSNYSKANRGQKRKQEIGYTPPKMNKNNAKAFKGYHLKFNKKIKEYQKKCKKAESYIKKGVILGED